MKTIRFFILPLLILTIFGCSTDTIIDEPRVEVDNGMKSLFNYDINEQKLLIWQPEDYQTTQDIIIESADTSMISISKAFYERLEHKVAIESVLNIIMPNQKIPFIRKVGFIDDRGDRYFMETEQATLEDMFKNLDAEFTSEPYYSESNVTRTGIPAAGFVDGEGKIHPTSYVVDYPDGTQEIIDARQYVATRAAMDLTMEWKIEQEFKVPTPEWVELKVGLNSTLYAYAHIGIDISWFQLQSFEAKVGGGFKLDLPVSMKMEAELIKKSETDTDLIEGPRISAVFFVGVVPVSIGITPKLNFVTEVGGRGYFESGFGFDYDMSFEAGVRFDKGVGWSPINSSRQEFNCRDFEATAGLEVTAKAGVYAKMAVDIYCVESVNAKIGAYIKGTAGAKLSTNPAGLTVNYHCDWGINGKLEAGVSVLRYSLASWEKDFELYGPKTICDYENTYPW